jgi:hypothetical protein
MKLFTIGCSFTEGQGLLRPHIESYTSILAEKLQMEYFNFGACGMSNDYIFRKVFELLNSNTIHKEDILIIQWTHYTRKELPTVFNEKEWYHTIPNSLHAYEDKVILERDGIKSVQNKYKNLNPDNERIELESNNKKILETYILQFLNEEYQINTTKNYINSLYTYLEHFGYKHIHFFGWDACMIENMYFDKLNFLKETFGGYTKTPGNEHPDNFGHKIWATILYEKINELEYTIGFKPELKNNKKII